MSETTLEKASFPRLRMVDPRALKRNPRNPRKIPASPAQEEQLRASIKSRGIIQFPVVAEKDGDLIIRAGHRRVTASIVLELPTIWTVETEPDNISLMDAVAENLIRASMNNVDTWRSIQDLEAEGWSEQAIADSLAQPLRTVRRLKLLAHIHPPMLDAIARGDMPNEEQLRAIAGATLEEQAQVWKKHKPRKNERTNWFAVSNALAKRHIPFSAAKFDNEIAAKYGVEWVDDLFAPADEDGRYTTNVDGFFGAQQEWLEKNIPKGGTLVPQDDYGHPQLPKKAQHVYGKPAKGDITGFYLDPRTAEVKTVVYRLPDENKAGKGKAKGAAGADPTPAKSRPDVTQKGNAIIGDFRTDALHEAVLAQGIEDITLIALLVLALGGRNVSVQSGTDDADFDRDALCKTLIEGGVLTADRHAIHHAARGMLVATLSCRDNVSNSGVVARIAGETIGASLRLPSMATEEFLSCLSRHALEREAGENGLRVEARVKDTRARMVSHFAGATWHYPGALFKPTAADIEDLSPGNPENGEAGEGDETELPTESAEDLAEGEMADAAD